MSEPSPIRPAGPVLRAVVTMHLKDDRGAAVPPRPTTEHGGLTAAPAGSIVRLHIGDARTFYSGYADLIVGALVDAAEIEVIGSDPRGPCRGTGPRPALPRIAARRAGRPFTRRPAHTGRPPTTRTESSHRS